MAEKKYDLIAIIDSIECATNFARGISDCVTGMASFGCDEYKGLQELVDHHFCELDKIHKQLTEYWEPIEKLGNQMHAEGATFQVVRPKRSKKKPKLKLVSTAPASA